MNTKETIDYKKMDALCVEAQQICKRADNKEIGRFIEIAQEIWAAARIAAANSIHAKLAFGQFGQEPFSIETACNTVSKVTDIKPGVSLQVIETLLAEGYVITKE